MNENRDHMAHLEALAGEIHACNQADDTDTTPVARITVNPICLHADPNAWKHCHNIDLTAAGLIEILKMLGADYVPHPIRARAADTTNSPQDATAFATAHAGLAAELTDVFASIEPLELQGTVLDHRDADLPEVIQAIDDVLGDRYDPLADEDDD